MVCHRDGGGRTETQDSLSTRRKEPQGEMPGTERGGGRPPWDGIGVTGARWQAAMGVDAPARSHRLDAHPWLFGVVLRLASEQSCM